MPPLQMKLRLEMEHRFGVSFDGVHVIESWLPLSFGALACVHGQRIYVVPGLGNLDCFAAKEILAHELAHVVQQRYGMTSEYSGLCEDVELEAEAEELGRLAAGGKRVRVRTRGNSAIAGGQPVWQCIKTTFAGISSPKLLQILDRSVNALIQSISLNIYEDKDKKKHTACRRESAGPQYAEDWPSVSFLTVKQPPGCPAPSSSAPKKAKPK